jgi:membrane protein
MSPRENSAAGKPVVRNAKVMLQAVQRFGEKDMSTYAAALAFQAFFSIFPFLLFLIALLAFLDVPQFFDWLTQQVSLVVPHQAIDQVMRVIQQIRTPNSTLLSFGVAAALWASSAGVREMMAALTVIAGLRETRHFALRVVLSLVYTILLAAMLIASAVLFTIGPEAANWVAEQFGVSRSFAQIWSWLRLPLWLVLLALTVTLIYYLAPARRQPLKSLLPGAVLSVLVWVLSSLAFSWYLSNFANYSALYGSIGTIIAVLFYFLLSSTVLLFGAAVNAVLLGPAERPTPAVNPSP